MSNPGPLFIIGGGEDKEGDREILDSLAERLAGRKLVIATIASQRPRDYFSTYREVFGELGVTDTAELYLEDRSQSTAPDVLATLEGAAGVFFTGGDQLRISSQIGDTPVERRVREIHAAGGVVAGTSAGASVMCETMLVRGPGSESHRIGDVHMAPGLGLIRDVIIDQHFAERGRFGRLLGAVAQNPTVLGVGIDEDTAIIVEGDTFNVVGEGAVYVIDGASVSRSNIAEAEPERTLSMFDVSMHVLSKGDRFSLSSRRPST
ncbi:cyanophycinase [Phenylobacterium sp. LjRoot164]|uniref:cyanophycinase n=1 Tax=unclassified Phenylobacterium TaxID=2640670 RepID=UPI003ECEBC3C